VSGPADRKQRPASAPKTVKADGGVNHEVMRRVKAPHRPVLVVISGPEQDAGKRVLVEETLLIGRDPQAALMLTDSKVSWHHATLEDRGDSWTLVDLGSTNGIVQNGQQVPECVLAPGDSVVLGNTVLRFELQDGLSQAYNQVVERLLNIDDLSGLYVRRKFDAELAAMIEAARQTGKPAVLLVMDMDGIKRINDSHGHLFGAYVIGEAGRLIGEVIGARGIGCRFGGDEFLAAFAELDVEAGMQLGESIRRTIAEHPFEREGIRLEPGISVGVAAFPENATDAPTLFQRADEALYRAKQAGKNRVCR
jgi:two-component system, cell cycle response regulator